MFEKSKAKEALSYLGEQEDLSSEALLPLAKAALCNDPEWALNAYAYLYYSAQSTSSAANLLTACCFLDADEAVAVNTEFPPFAGNAKDALKYLEKCYIYDQITDSREFTALIQGYARFGSTEKALGTEYNLPDSMKSDDAKYIAAILAWQSGEEVDLNFYDKFTGEQRYSLEYAYATQHDFPTENLISIAKGSSNLAVLKEVFSKLNARQSYEAVCARAEGLIDLDVDEDLFYEIVFALNKVGNAELITRYNDTFTGELYKANYEAALTPEEEDLTEQARALVQDEIDELVASMDYQNADRLSKAFYNQQIRQAVMNEAEENELELLAFVPCFID